MADELRDALQEVVDAYLTPAEPDFDWDAWCKRAADALESSRASAAAYEELREAARLFVETNGGMFKAVDGANYVFDYDAVRNYEAFQKLWPLLSDTPSPVGGEKGT